MREGVAGGGGRGGRGRGEEGREGGGIRKGRWEEEG